MKNTDSIGRRSFVRGLGIAALAAATGAVVAAPVLSAAAAVSTSDMLIAAHRRARLALHKAIDRQDELDVIPRPRVKVGTLIGSFGRPDSPIWAYTEAEIEKHRKQWFRAYDGWPNAEARSASIKSKLDAASADLAKQHRRYARLARVTGLTAANKTRLAAYRIEAEARAALVLSKPQDLTAAGRKQAYMRRHKSLFEDGGDEDFIAALIRQSIKTVEG